MSLGLKFILAFFIEFDGMSCVLYFTVIVCFYFLQIWMAGLRRGSNLPFSDAFGFPKFGSRVGFWMDCLIMCWNTISDMRICSSNVFCLRLLFTISGILGALVFPIWRSESCRGTGFV